MIIEGDAKVAHPVSVVWNGLTDCEIMLDCIPGCKLFEKESDSRYKAIVGAKLALFKISFTIHIDVNEAIANERYDFMAQGDGGLSGMAKGRCEINTLSDGESASTLVYRSTVEMNGLLHKIAEPLLKNRAQVLIQKFFTRFEKSIDKDLLI